jgi:hypothetical protein
MAGLEGHGGPARPPQDAAAVWVASNLEIMGTSPIEWISLLSSSLLLQIINSKALYSICFGANGH